MALYDEGYRLLTARDGEFGRRPSVTWAEAGRLPLCLLTPDMQNRRIIDQMLRGSGAPPEPTLVSNSTIVLISHVRTGRWSSILPPILADSIGLPENVASIPITDPEYCASQAKPTTVKLHSDFGYCYKDDRQKSSSFLAISSTKSYPQSHHGREEVNNH